MRLWRRIGSALVLPLLLTGCLLVPGKFSSSLTIHADRTFAFAYKGELIASDPAASPADGMPNVNTPQQSAADAEGNAQDKAAKLKEREDKNRAIAAALSRERGYRSVSYRGNGIFDVDYAVDGVLTTNFVFPFNSDAEAMLPFIAVEVRKDGTVRVRAPAFGRAANQGTAGPSLPMMNDPSDRAEGSFTLATDAEIIAQNQEGGARSEGSNKVIVWTVGKIKQDAPTAVLKMRN
jgi:hypothetical protein